MKRTLIAGVVLALVAACSQPTGEASSSGDAQTYRVGALAALSGALAPVGKQSEAGMRTAVEEINSTGFLGKGATLEVDIQDTAGEPARAIGAATRWAQDSKILGVACCVFTQEAIAVQPILPAAGTPMVLNGSINQDLVKSANVYRGFPLVQAGDTEVTEAVLKAVHPKTVTVLYTQDNEGMVDAKDNIETVLSGEGIKPTFVGTQTADTSYAGPATQIAAADPDLVIVLLLGNSNGQATKELRDRGYRGTVVADTVASAKAVWGVGGQALVGTLMAVAFDPNSEVQATTNFISRWNKQFPDREPDQVGAIGYMSIWLLARAIKDAGESDRAAVAKAMAAMDKVKTPMGELDYSGTREPRKTDPFALVQWSADDGGSLVPWDGTVGGMLHRPDVG